MTPRGIPRLIIAGTHSGVGKTTVTVGLIATLRQRGLTVQPFKAGPDYIDPTYHSLAAGRPCRNLDTWMVPPERVRALFAHAAREADIAIVEGVMGVYDGCGYEDEAGSTAQLAKLLDAPVILVLDAGSMARSAGAVALGYQRFDPDLSVAGFIINRVASEGHGQGVATAIRGATGLPILGWLPRCSELEMPERHLGLVPTPELSRCGSLVEAAADHVVRHLDLDHLLSLARRAPLLATDDSPVFQPSLLQALGRKRVGDLSSAVGRPVIAVARDEAFNFTYEDNLDLLRAAGAEIVFFSPLRDAALPPGTAGIILSGGFPELYADRLAANDGMREALHEAHRQKIPIYAECGGLMYLTEAIVDLEGREHSMVGLLPGRSVMSDRLIMGYRLAQAAGDSWLLAAGETVRGHEFHHSVWEGRPADLPPAYHVLPHDGLGDPRPEGARLGSMWASYVHLHLWARPTMAVRFVEACR